MTWNDMSRENQAAAAHLVTGGHHRSCVNRAYFAAYCAVTGALEKGGVDFGHGGNNPTHGDLPNLIVHNLTTLRKPERAKVRQALQRLQKRRVVADYVPTVAVDMQDARSALRDARLVLDRLGLNQ